MLKNRPAALGVRWFARGLHATPARLGVARGYDLDLSGKVAFVAGVADSSGYGWAVARQLASAGATVAVGTWPPAMVLFKRELRRGGGDQDGFPIDRMYPLDAVFSTPAEVPEDVRSNKRYAGLSDYDIQSCAAAVAHDYGKIDILVHALANGPEVNKPLLETSRAGYLAASSASAYSMVAMVANFGPIMRRGGSCVSLTFIASERVVPGYGGGLSSAKAQLESDTKVLAWEAGRKYGIRVNTISAGPLASRAASAITNNPDGDKFIDSYIAYCRANAPLARPLSAADIGRAALALCSPLADAITGTCQYVDNGMHAMGVAADEWDAGPRLGGESVEQLGADSASECVGNEESDDARCPGS